MNELLNMGSIQKIEITEAINITLGIPNTNNEVAVTNSGSWEEILFTLETASYSENEKPVKEGSIFTSTLTWQLPKVSPTNYAASAKYRNKELIIKITDANNTIILIGEPSNPAFVNVVKSIPAKVSGINAYNFTVKHESTHSAYFIA